MDDFQGSGGFTEKFALIIPCYNFEKGLPKTFDSLLRWRKKNGLEAALSVYFVDDSSIDRTTSLLQGFAVKNEHWCHVIKHPRNLGKGRAIRTAFEVAARNHEKVIFSDCDLHYGLQIIVDRILPSLDSSDIVLVDRSWVADAQHQLFLRRLASGLFKRFVSVLTGVNYRDTQAGLKGFRSPSCQPVFELLTIDGFAFDVEILSIGLFYRMKATQIPISYPKHYSYPETSTVRIIRSSLSMILALLKINWNWKTGRYRSAKLIQRLNDTVYELR